jgi:hypothetical protein
MAEDYSDLDECCLNCDEPICDDEYCDHCLCLEGCEHYNEEGYCELARPWKSTNLNLLVHIRNDGWIFVKFDGPISKTDYAKVRPFLKEHFQYNWDNKRYQIYSKNPKFIELLIQILQEANFTNINFTEAGIEP